MTTTSRDAAIICAVLEILPAAPRDLSYLLEDLDSVEDLLIDVPTDKTRASGMHRYIAQTTDKGRVAHWERHLVEVRQTLPDMRIVSVRDALYPSAVRGAYDRPPLLFFRGQLPTACTVAVVGSRSASPMAREFATDATSVLVQSGCAIVSGLALGIDAAAHMACIDAGGHTVAVLGHALDNDIYPPAHETLARRVVERGALVSQFRPGSPPTSSSFVQRNALISGFAQASLVVTADERSGSRSELDAALAQGRIVLLPRFATLTNRWMRALGDGEDRVFIVDSPADVAQVIAETCAMRDGSAGHKE